MNSPDLNQLSIIKNSKRENWSVQIIISAAKCELTLNDDIKHIKATNEHY